MQTQQLLNSRAIFLAGSALYLALLAAWAPSGILTDIFSAFQSSSGFPEACHVGRSDLAAIVWPDVNMPHNLQVSRIASLFARADVTALSWLHLALMDAFAAR